MKKLVTLLVALAMVLALGTAAMAADMGTGVESDPYVYYGAPQKTDVVPAGGSIYCEIYRVAGMILTINDADAYVIHNGVTYEAVDGVVTAPLSAGMPMAPVSLVIGNKGAEDKAFDCTFAVPLGDWSNPEVLEDVSSMEVSLAEGNNQGYYYKWVATQSGYLCVNGGAMNPDTYEEVSFNVVLSNNTTFEQTAIWTVNSAYEDVKSSPAVLKVSEGDEVMIQLMVQPDENYNIPAADVWASAFVSQGTAEDPIFMSTLEQVVHVGAGETIVYSGRFIGLDCTIKGANVTVSNNGVDYTDEDGDGVISFVINGAGDFFAPPPTIAITNNGEAAEYYDLVISYPVGHSENPEVIPGLGEFTCSVPEGGSGYYYNFTATADGTLYFILDEVSGVAADLVDISVYNLNSYEAKGLWEYDDMGNASTTGYVAIKVTAGDELQIMVNTLPDENWTYSAADVTFTVSNEAPSSDETGDMIGVVVAMLAVSGMGITVLKKKEF